jgi:hypothetical protein
VHGSGHLHDGITRLPIGDGRGDAFSFDARSRNLFKPMYACGLELLGDLFPRVGFTLRRRVRHGCDVAVDRVAPDVKKGDVRIERFGQVVRPLQQRWRDRQVVDRHEQVARSAGRRIDRDQHRNGRHSHDTLGGHAEQLRWARSIAVGSDDDEVSVQLSGQLRNLLVRFPDANLRARGTRRQVRRDLVQTCGRVFTRVRFDHLGRGEEVPSKMRAVRRLDHMGENHLGVGSETLRGPLRGFDRGIAQIHADDHSPDRHRCAPDSDMPRGARVAPYG